MTFTVIVRRPAQADLDNAVKWWSRHGKAASDRWRVGLLTTVVSALESDPHRYPRADEAEELEMDLRVMLYGRRRQVYRILFTIEGETVFVHRVRHSAQDRLSKGDI